MKKQEMFMLFTYESMNLDSIISNLQGMKDFDSETNYYVDFLGHRLYSDTINTEDAYQEVYNMTRDEYRKELERKYQEYQKRQEEYDRKRKIELEEQKERILNQAREVIPEDKIPIFIDAIPSICGFYIGYDEDRIKCFLEIIKELNKDDYDLDKVNNLFSIIKPYHTLSIRSILQRIKALAKHGDVLFNEYLDVVERADAIIKEYRENPIKLSSTPLLETPIRITHDQELDAFDRKISFMRQYSYMVREEEKEKTH